MMITYSLFFVKSLSKNPLEKYNRVRLCREEFSVQMEKTPRNEIVVILDPNDQTAFGIRYATMSFSDFRTRRFCEHLAVLVCLREGTGQSGNITVRALENAAGELLLYFSLPGEGEERCVYSQVIEFADLDGLLDSRCAFLRDPDLCAEIYRWNGKYYLWYEFYTSPVRFDDLTLTMLEYGNLSFLDRSFLAEHATLLPDAVSLFLT